MSKVCDAVIERITPIVEEMGIEIVDIEYKKQYEQMNLTVFIDKDGGISLDDCEAVHRAIDAPLDELNPTGDSPYVLNVSSPGLDRPLKNKRDFEKNIGKEVEIGFYVNFEGKKRIEAVLLSFDDVSINVEINKKQINILRKNIAIIKPAIKF